MLRRSLSTLALLVALGGWPALAAAQQYTPESCAALKANRQQMIDNPDIFGGRQGIALLAEVNSSLQNFCGEAP